MRKQIPFNRLEKVWVQSCGAALGVDHGFGKLSAKFEGQETEAIRCGVGGIFALQGFNFAPDFGTGSWVSPQGWSRV